VIPCSPVERHRFQKNMLPLTPCSPVERHRFQKNMLPLTPCSPVERHRFQKNMLPLTPAVPFPFLLSLYTDVFARGLFFHSEEVGSFETLANSQQTTWRHIPVDKDVLGLSSAVGKFLSSPILSCTARKNSKVDCSFWTGSTHVYQVHSF
jgi:hypothetical protein